MVPTVDGKRVPIDEFLDWPMTAAEAAEAERLRWESWGTGIEAQTGVQAALGGLGLDPDTIPSADVLDSGS